MRIAVNLLIIIVLCSCSKGANIEPLINKYVKDKRETYCDIKFEDGVLKGETEVAKLKEALVLGLKRLDIDFVDSLKILPEKLGDGEWGLVNLSVANLRAAPRYSAEMVTQAIMGTPVRILKRESGWWLVKTPDRYVSWIPSSSVTALTLSDYSEWKVDDRVIFTSNYGTISNMDGEVVTDVVAGSILRVVPSEDGLIHISLPNGVEGIVDSIDVKDFDQWKAFVEPTPESLISRGRSLMGVPYLWGGTSIKGLDCSGFVKTLYFLHGVVIARDASLQINHGRVVEITDSLENLQAGDLLFFGANTKATHVGMYIGDGDYIHEAGRVKINSFDSKKENYSEYRRKTLLGVRRYTRPTRDDNGILQVLIHSWY